MSPMWKSRPPSPALGGTPILMDGGMGTMLFAHGAPPDSCLEELNQTRPSLIAEVHRSYTEAGARVIVTNSFGGNRLRLGRNANRLERLNSAAVRIARQAAACLPV